MTNSVIWIKRILRLSAVAIKSLHSSRLCGKVRFEKNEHNCPKLLYYIYEHEG